MTPAKTADVALIKACAEALGYSVVPGGKRFKNGMQIATKEGQPVTNFDPLAHDAEAFELLLLLNQSGTLHITHHDFMFEPGLGNVFFHHGDMRDPATFRRAICECVAKRSH